MDAFLGEIWTFRTALATGLVLTLAASVAAVLLGTLLGVAIGIGLTYAPLLVRLALRAYVDIVRGTPVLVIILAAYYLPAVIGIDIDPFEAGVLALSLFCGAHVGEIVRGGLRSIPKGQTEAARSIGLTMPRILLYVLAPQALRHVMPTWVNVAVEIVKSSTLLSIIGVGELMLKTQEIVGRNFMTLQFYATVGAVYVAINYAIQKGGRLAERRFRSR